MTGSNHFSSYIFSRIIKLTINSDWALQGSIIFSPMKAVGNGMGAVEFLIGYVCIPNTIIGFVMHDA